MKKASNILLLLSGIFGILGAVTLLFLAIFVFTLTSPGVKEQLLELVQSGKIEIPPDFEGTVNEFVDYLQKGFVIIGVVLIIALLFVVAGVVVYFLARNKDTLALYIVALVLSILTGSILAFLGSLFGLITKSQEKQIEAVQE